MVPKGPKKTHNTKVKISVNELISSPRFGNCEREECIETKVFGSHNGMLNSHTLKLGVFWSPKGTWEWDVYIVGMGKVLQVI